MYTFKDFLRGKKITEAGAAGMAAPTTGPAGAASTTGTAAGANSALAQQSAQLQQQIGDMNTRLQRLMQQKAQIDKQIQAQATQNSNQTASTQATQAAAAVSPGNAPTTSGGT